MVSLLGVVKHEILIKSMCKVLVLGDKVGVRISAIPLSGNNRVQVVQAGKVTVGLASHLPCVTDQWLIHLRAHGLKKGGEHPAYTQHGRGMALLYLVEENASHNCTAAAFCCFFRTTRNLHLLGSRCKCNTV